MIQGMLNRHQGADGQRYRFRYPVDGREWLNDWHADDYVENSCGSDNSVVDLTTLGSLPLY